MHRIEALKNMIELKLGTDKFFFWPKLLCEIEVFLVNKNKRPKLHYKKMATFFFSSFYMIDFATFEVNFRIIHFPNPISFDSRSFVP
jgi:hypothetical protein